MPYKYKREQVAKLIVGILQKLHFNPEITEESKYGVNIIIDDKVKGLCYYAIVIHLEELGYLTTNFSLEDCTQAESVWDIVNAVWNDVKYDHQDEIKLTV
jgi:hypothetical protein